MSNREELKNQVQNYWNEQACGTQFSDNEKFTKEYFEDIENKRYTVEPEIFSFAQFSRFFGKNVLEVGVGAGTDFLQWVRSGANAYGIDLTQEAVDHVHHRLEVYGLKAKEIKVADSENIPFEEDFFDLVYSWGVIHHTPDTFRALDEIIRVCKPGGICKIMIYHRHSLLSYFFWVKHALLKGKIFKSLSKVLWEQMESIGTKAYTVSEVREILKTRKVNSVIIQPILSYHDKLGRFNKLFRLTARFFALLLGYNRVGWFLTIEFKKDFQ